MSNPYKILGVKKTDSKKNIAKAYRILAKKWHPDKHLNNKNYAEDKFKEISKAYQQIVNPERMYHNNGVFTPEFDEEKINKFTENILEKGKQFSDWFVKLKKMDFSNLTDNFLKEAVKYKEILDHPLYKFINNICRWGNFNNIRILQRFPLMNSKDKIYEKLNITKEEIELIEYHTQ